MRKVTVHIPDGVALDWPDAEIIPGGNADGGTYWSFRSLSETRQMPPRSEAFGFLVQFVSALMEPTAEAVT